MLFDPMYPALIAVVCQFLRYTDGFRSCCRIYLWNLKNSGEGRMFLNLRVWQHKNLLHTSTKTIPGTGTLYGKVPKFRR